MKKIAPLLSLLLLLISCDAGRDLTTVKNVDIERYVGTWYEIARLPNSFQKNLDCVTATYTLKENGKIEVYNKGLNTVKGKWSDITGSAKVVDETYPGRLKVTFFWPFAGNYYIIALDEAYQYALVGDPSRKYLWILSRNSTLSQDIYDTLIDEAKNNDFDIDKLHLTNQVCK